MSGYDSGWRGAWAQPGAGASGRTPPRRAPEGSPARHCLVDGLPGLLVEWMRTGVDWRGRVVTVTWVDGPDGPGWALVERWLPATRITPLA